MAWDLVGRSKSLCFYLLLLRELTESQVADIQNWIMDDRNCSRGTGWDQRQKQSSKLGYCLRMQWHWLLGTCNFRSHWFEYKIGQILQNEMMKKIIEIRSNKFVNKGFKTEILTTDFYSIESLLLQLNYLFLNKILTWSNATTSKGSINLMLKTTDQFLTFLTFQNFMKDSS